MRHERGPAGLVAGAEARAGVAVEVLVERDLVVPGGSVQEPRCAPSAGRRPSASRHEQADQPAWRGRRRPRPACSCCPEPVGYSTSKSSPKSIGVAQQRPDRCRHVEREPDRAAPVGVAAEQAGLRLGRLVADGEVACRRGRALNGSARWRRLQRADAVRRQELGLVEHPAQDRLQLRSRPTTPMTSCRLAPPDRADHAEPVRVLGLVLQEPARSRWRRPWPARAGARRRVALATSGSRPTIERTLSCASVPSGCDQSIEEEARPRRPTGPAVERRRRCS